MLRSKLLSGLEFLACEMGHIGWISIYQSMICWWKKYIYIWFYVDNQWMYSLQWLCIYFHGYFLFVIRLVNSKECDLLTYICKFIMWAFLGEKENRTEWVIQEICRCGEKHFKCQEKDCLLESNEPNGRWESGQLSNIPECSLLQDYFLI